MRTSQLLTACLPAARRLARPPVSSFKVGAVALGETGALHFGANLEVKGGGPGFCVHAEQTAIVNALAGGETGWALPYPDGVP